MEHDIKELDRKGLREFGLTTGGIVAVLFGLFFPWLLERPIPRWPWVIAGILVAWGLAAPASLRPVYRGWMKFGLLLSKVTTPLIMGIVFFLVVTPMGLVRRLAGKDSLARHFDSAASYRVPSHKAPVSNLEKPF
ncbi:MAG: SxtJ family membrane protein [Gammaproteobacteria bacterium]|nr:MAG: SxtJ family membrane protein [Gammaproteobacteria bacterium]